MKKHILILSFLISYTVLSYSQPVNVNDVTISRDKWGVPHIHGKTDRDAAYGLAWAHCEDDFKTIQITYLIATGMYGRYKGKDGVGADYLQQLMRIPQFVNDSFETGISEEYKIYVDAYCQALNKYALLHPEEVLIKDLFPVDVKSTFKGYLLSVALMSGIDRQFKKLRDKKIFFKDDEIQLGSNAFAFSKKRMSEGLTTLVINAHQPIEGIMSFYEAHMMSDQGMNIHGGTFPGGTSIFHGTTQNYGWAHTSNSFDKIDVFKLRMHPTIKNHYYFDGKVIPLEVSKATLKVKGIPFPIKKKIYWSVYGGTMKTSQGFFSIRMPALMEIGAAEEWYHMSKCSGYSEYMKVLQRQQIAMQNITYADRYDTIMFMYHGIAANRDLHYDWKYVLPGDTSATLWKSYLPVDSLPLIVNPPCGYVYNVNHGGYLSTCSESSLKPENFNPTASFEAHHNNRSLRFNELYQADKPFSLDSLKKIKYDLFLPQSGVYFEMIKRMQNLDPNKYPNIKEALLILKNWNYSMDTNSRGAAIFYVSQIPLFKATYMHTTPFYTDMHLTDDNLAFMIRFATKHLLKHFNTVNIPLGQIQRHSRGNINLPLGGFPDVLGSMYGLMQKDGTFRAYRGEDLIMYVQWDGVNKFPSIQTIKAYGNSSKENSPHFNDQMKLYSQWKTKEMSLDPEWVKRNAVSVYHPK